MSHAKTKHQKRRVAVLVMLKRVECVEAHVTCPDCRRTTVFNEYRDKAVLDRLNAREMVDVDCKCGQRARLIGKTIEVVSH